MSSPPTKSAPAASASRTFVAGGDHQDFLRLAQTVRQDDRAADHLVGVLGIDSKAQRDFDRLVKLGELHFLQQRHRIIQKIGALLDCLPRLRYILSCFLLICFSLSPTANRCSAAVVFAT